jgi:M6 family metalloprotease-like protein
MRVLLGVLAAFAMLAAPAAAADFPPPIDPQVVQDQDDMTWDDYKPVPGTDWNNPDLVPSERQLKIAVVAVDFEDQPFVITQPKHSDPFGNPQIDPIAREDVPEHYAEFLGTPNALNQGHTVTEYWMEQTHGRIGMTFTPYGPYRMPRPLYEYGLNEFNQNGETRDERPTGGGCPTGHRCDGNMDRDVDALWRADAGQDIRDQYDLVLRVYAGYDETTVWQEFGEMKFETKEEIPDEWGNPDPTKPNWVTNRYVPWTTWRAGAQQWGLSSIRQGESSGTITHEIVHTFGLPDNNNNPYIQPYHRVGTGPWDILDRGSFNGPGGPHKRWLVPVTQGGAMEAGITLRSKLSEDWIGEDDVHRTTRSDLAASGLQVLRVRARSSAAPGDEIGGIKIDLDGGDRSAACDTDTEPLCSGNDWEDYQVETVQRIGVDSMTPDSGVMITKNKDRSTSGCGYRCFGWTIDAHPEDINQVDFYRPRTHTPVMRTIGDYRQLNDALFHAGTDSGSQYEYEDAPNGLHFYVLDVKEDADGVKSYDVGVRSLDGDGPHKRGVALGRPALALDPAGVSTCTFSLTNTGETAPVAAPEAPLDDPNAVDDADIYRLSAESNPGLEVHLANALAWAKTGQTVSVPVYVKAADPSKFHGVVRLRATSESDPTKSATAACALTGEPGTVGGAVRPTLSLALGTPASFGTFQPGTTATYTAVQAATVTSSAGEATLTVTDPSPVETGHLVNGSFSLPEPLKAAGSALPAVAKSYGGPVANDSASIALTQLINAGEALRTGTYSKTLTFTLSTTLP